MDDEEPECEGDRTDGGGVRKDPDHRSGALVMTGCATSQDPGMIQLREDLEGAEQQREQREEGDEDAQEYAP
jgi:hypothetical protein